MGGMSLRVPWSLMVLNQVTQPRVASSTSSTLFQGPWPGPRISSVLYNELTYVPQVWKRLRANFGPRRWLLVEGLAWIPVQEVEPYFGVGWPISMVRVRSFHQGMVTGGSLAVRSTGE